MTASGTQTIQILPNESRVIGMDFSSWNDAIIAGTETLTGTPTVSVTKAGAAMGSEITIGTASLASNVVSMRVTTSGATPGAIYKFDVRCNTTGSNVAQGVRYLEVIQEG